MNYETLYNNIQAYSENTEALFVASIPVFVQQAEERIYNSVQIPALRKNVTGSVTTSNPYLALPDDWLSNYSLAVIDTAGSYTYLLNKDVNFIREAYPVNNAAAQGLPKYYGLFGSQYGNINEMTLIVGPTPDANYAVEMHYFYYPPTIIQGQISLLGSVTGGSLYTNGLYQNVSLTGGSGSGATADILVSGGAVTTVTLKFGGQFYKAGDVLSADQTSIGGSGTGFSIPVSAISNSTGTSWLGDNFDPVLLYGAMREAMLFMKGEQDLVGYYEQKFQEALGMLRRLGDGLERGDAYRDGQLKVDVSGGARS
jgi:hypothetical protein